MIESENAYTLRESCRVCNKKELEPVLSLGEQHIVNFLESSDQESIKVPLDLVLCNKKKEGVVFYN